MKIQSENTAREGFVTQPSVNPDPSKDTKETAEDVPSTSSSQSLSIDVALAIRNGMYQSLNGIDPLTATIDALEKLLEDVTDNYLKRMQVICGSFFLESERTLTGLRSLRLVVSEIIKFERQTELFKKNIEDFFENESKPQRSFDLLSQQLSLLRHNAESNKERFQIDLRFIDALLTQLQDDQRLLQEKQKELEAKNQVTQELESTIQQQLELISQLQQRVDQFQGVLVVRDQGAVIIELEAQFAALARQNRQLDRENRRAKAQVDAMYSLLFSDPADEH